MPKTTAVVVGEVGGWEFLAQSSESKAARTSSADPEDAFRFKCERRDG